MRRVLCALALSSAFFAWPIFSESPEKAEVNRLPHEIGIYFKDYFPVGRMSDHSFNFMGGGVSYAWHSPWYLPLPNVGGVHRIFGQSLNVGFSFRADAVGAWYQDYVDSWWTTNLLGGVFLEWQVNDWLAIQPSIEYGLQLDIVKSSDRIANGTYVSQALQFSPTFKFSPGWLREHGLALEAAPLWTMGFEKHGVAHYLGIRLGMMWRFGKYDWDVWPWTQDGQAKDEKAAAKADKQREKEAAEQAEKERMEKAAREQAAREQAEREEQERLAAEQAEREEDRSLDGSTLLTTGPARDDNDSAQGDDEVGGIDEARAAALKEATANPEMAMRMDEAAALDFTPDGDGVNDTLSIAFDKSMLTEGAEEWKMEVSDAQGWTLAVEDKDRNVIRTISGKGDVPDTIEWDGLDDDGKPVASESEYVTRLTVTPGQNDRKALGTDQITLERKIKTGVIMRQSQEAKDEWNINIPSFKFDANAATFKGLSAAERAELNRTLDTMAQKIKAIDGASVTVEGYANNTSNTRKEHERDLLPLSQKRAEAIAQMLVDRGLPAGKVKAVGRGGENPIAAWEDKANWWKNRRIELVIKKGGE